jgi:hypothetical protein
MRRTSTRSPTLKRPVERVSGILADQSAVAQTTAVVHSTPLHVGRCGVLVADLAIASLTGTLAVLVQTTRDPNAQGAVWRTIGAFTSASAAGSESISCAPTDEWIRIQATPGNGNGQTAAWQVTGTIGG